MKKTTMIKKTTPAPIDWRKITTWKKVCQVNGISTKLPAFLEVEEDLRAYLKAVYQLTHITKALNGTDKIDFTDGKWKYWPRFWVNKSGSGFSFTYYDYWFTFSDVGSRLSFLSSEKAMHSAKHFEKIHIIHQLK